MKKQFNVLVFIICILIVFLFLGGIGGLFTSSNTNSVWYNEIKPEITPPNFVFPIVWNILFLLISISLYLVWTNSNKKQKKKVALVFGINFILNILWSVLFFQFKLITLAFIEIIFLWFSILVMVFVTRKINKPSSWLLIPYLVWVGFATIINGIIIFG